MICTADKSSTNDKTECSDLKEGKQNTTKLYKCVGTINDNIELTIVNKPDDDKDEDNIMQIPDDNLRFDVCEFQCNSKKNMNDHNIEISGEDGDFNCKYCPFQGNNNKVLSNHLDNAHQMRCHNCGKIFKTKNELMIHRKSHHPDKIRICRYIENGYCTFGRECWYNHSQENTGGSNQSSVENYRCTNCEDVFTSRSNMMNHRKNVHSNTIPKCRDYEKGNCTRSDQNCWYIHDATNVPMDTSEVFQGVMGGQFHLGAKW